MPTSNLERRLEGFYDGLLQVRIADVGKAKAIVRVHDRF